VRYGSKPLEFAKGKNSIELASEADVADTLRKVREAAELGELDALIEQQAQFGRRLTLKNRRTCIIQHVLRRTVCECRLRKLLTLYDGYRSPCAAW